MNIRYAAVLGIVGAGGIGTVVLASMKNLDYPTTSASILVLLALLVVVDRTSSFIRRKLK
jgi:phosphonate transport system permease protein